MQILSNIFNHPFFIILGGLATLFSVVVFLFTIYLFIKGIFPVLYRLGMGLAKRKIAIFAEEEFDSLKSMLVDSKIFQPTNIVRVDKGSIKKAGDLSLFLVDWNSFGSEIDKIIDIKKDAAALVIYAPPRAVSDIDMGKINSQRNSIIVNFRGRLLNDILTSMMTTSFKER